MHRYVTDALRFFYADDLHADVLRAILFPSQRDEMLRSLERQGNMVLDTVPERLTIDAVNRYLALKTGARI